MDLSMGETIETILGTENPTLYDYLAGAMLVNGIIWIWGQALGAFQNFFIQFSPSLLADLSYVIYLIATIFTSMQVCRRAKTNHLIVGLKFAVASWIHFLLILISMAPTPTFGLAFSFLLIFIFGSVTGAYLFIRRRIKPSETTTEIPDKS